MENKKIISPDEHWTDACYNACFRFFSGISKLIEKMPEGERRDNYIKYKDTVAIFMRQNCKIGEFYFFPDLQYDKLIFRSVNNPGRDFRPPHEEGVMF